MVSMTLADVVALFTTGREDTVDEGIGPDGLIRRETYEGARRRRINIVHQEYVDIYDLPRIRECFTAKFGHADDECYV